MKWFLFLIIVQFIAWSTSEEPPGTMEGDSAESVAHAKEKCEQNKNQLELLKEIMLKNKQSLKKKEEEVQEYARKLSKIKSRAKLSRRSKDENLPCKDISHRSGTASADTSEGSIDDISQAKTAKAKSTLLQKKLAENRKVFEQRNKEITETKRAVEEKVEAIRQQLEEKDATTMGFQKDQLPVVPVKPVMISADIMSPTQIESIQEKEKQITALNNRILELEATIVDLQENLKEKDSVIESKTRAVTLMSEDLSRKGKTTLDTLEETKDEMQTMQEYFVLLEASWKNKNESLLAQLEGRDVKIAELEDSIRRFETGSATKEAMKSMQESFSLKESSLVTNNHNLLHQLEDYELKLAEANERIFKLESGIGITKDPTVDDLQYKLNVLEQSNKHLQDEKYELQKNIAELQDKILNLSVNGNNGALIEKDNRIVELENLIEELKQSNKLLEEESKAELQQKLADLTLKNEEYSNKISDLESLVHELEEQKSDMAARLSDESALKENEKVAKLSKELEELNKSMIRIKAQHRSKVKNLQKQLKNVRKVSDTNAELVRLGNQVALLEEEKGNLQLSLVDFDELKASAGDWQERVVDLESKVSAQTKEIEMQIEAIATLENQKLDLMQELHVAKQEISSLEAENAESENLRVTAEMKVVDLEEQLEAVHKSKLESSYNRISKLEEKGTSESGSTESFEAVQELDRSDLLKKIEDLMHKNNELSAKVNRYREKENSHAGSTEWLETMNERDKNELSKKEEKGSSDTGSTESFERIPEHTESMTKIELLTQENNELAIKLTKLEEQLETDGKLKAEVETLQEANKDKSSEVERLTGELRDLAEEKRRLQEQIESLTNVDSVERLKRSVDIETDTDRMKESEQDLRTRIEELLKENERVRSNLSEIEACNEKLKEDLTELTREKEELQVKINEMSREKSESTIVASLEREIEECRKLIFEQTGLIEEMKIKLAKKEEELEEKDKQLEEYEASGRKAERLENELKEMSSTMEEWKYKCNEMQKKMEQLEAGKASIEEGFEMLRNENRMLLEEKREKDAENNRLKQQSVEKEKELDNLKQSIEEKDQELHAKYTELQNKMIAIDSLQDECNNCKMLLHEKNIALTSMSNELANLKSKEEEIYNLRKRVEELNEKLEESKPSKDYDELLEQLKHKDTILDELHCRINATTKENSNLSEKVKSLSQQNNNIQSQLAEKQKELFDSEATSRKERDEAEGRMWELQSVIENNKKFVDDLQAELRGCYKQMEQDSELRKNLMEELNSKTKEHETSRDELEGKIVDLEEKLRESEDKIQSQLEKMKKLAANLKKKTTVCHELENRVAELEEKWTTEKDEKEAKNKQIQDVEIAMREKDNRILELEEKFSQATKENAELLKRIDELTIDSNNSKEKTILLMKQMEEMEEEIVKLRTDLESRTEELKIEKESKEKIISDYDSYKQYVTGENERKQVELEEVREKARELSVRMQVMEAEYVEQLALIKNLLAENGLLLSKQAQINEKLENVEKESEERRSLIERMQKTSIEMITESTQTTEEGHCEQCQTLEAKLQEREAEIENLDNELANSIGKFVRMNENSMRNRSLEDPYNDLLFQYNSLVSSHEEVKAKLEEVLKEKKELLEKKEQSFRKEIESLRSEKEKLIEDLRRELEGYRNESAPRLFDASKIFGSSFDSDTQEARCSNLTQEIDHLQRTMTEERSRMSRNYSQCLEELEISRKQLTAALKNVEELEESLGERDERIDALTVELKNQNQKENQLEELRASLNSTREALDAMIVERDQYNDLLQSYKIQMSNLEAELKNSTDNELIQDLEHRVSVTTKERDLLQLQVNDLSRSMEELMNSMSLQLEKISRERDELKEEVENLTRTLQEAHKRIETPTITEETSSTKESTLEEERLNVDEESWGWDEAQLIVEHASLIPSTEIQLRAKVEDLEDRIKELEKERERMIEENKAAQLRNAKMIKKLKEYKVQVEQLRTQKSSNDGLDSAIEEELKSQIDKLEKSLNEAREEVKNIIVEKEALTKRLDVVVSANERYMEMKERQDMDVEVLRIRNKELSDKIEALERKLQSEDVLQEAESVLSMEEKLVAQERLQKRSTEDNESLYKKYREEMDDLKDEMEALATENELLQRFLEEQKAKLFDLEKKRTAEENESVRIVDELNGRISELQTMLRKSREEYDSLRKQYEQSLMDANDQVLAMRQNTDFLKEEAGEKIGKLETEVKELHCQLETFESSNVELQRSLQDVLQEKTSLEERLTSSEKQFSSSMTEVTDLLNIRIQEVADLKQALQRQYVDHEEVKMKLQETIEELKEELVEKKQQLESLKESLSEKEKSVETVNALVSQATQELVQKHAMEVEEKEKRIQSLETTANEYSLENENILSRLEAKQEEVESLRQNLLEKNSILESLEANLTEKERRLFSSEERLEALGVEKQSLEETVEKLLERWHEFETNGLKSRMQSLESEYRAILENNEAEIDALKKQLNEKIERIDCLTSELEETRKIYEKLQNDCSSEEKENEAFQQMQMELEKRQEEIEHLKYVLNESTYPGIIREMQDTINCLYEEKAELKSSLEKLKEDYNQLLLELQTSNKDIEVLQDKLREKDEEVARVGVDLAEKERRLAELSITKDAEVHNLKVLFQEKEARVEELTALLNEEEKRMNEWKIVLEARETEINSLKKLLEDKTKEVELIQDVSLLGGSEEENKAFASQELDLALYMLHQRDVRCEELTHELMQLLEERDTLQLRLSNAIRVNEELRRSVGGDASKDEASTSGGEEPMVEHPSPSKSEGPVEIAKEAIDAPIGEDKEALALKLSQLQTVSHAKDVRLRDERELRHTQQMSLLAHKDVLSTLPPEAAARLVNANYTLSRDVQSQSSVLLNWLWGKSTPKVIHM